MRMSQYVAPCFLASARAMAPSFSSAGLGLLDDSSAKSSDAALVAEPARKARRVKWFMRFSFGVAPRSKLDDTGGVSYLKLYHAGKQLTAGESACPTTLSSATGKTNHLFFSAGPNNYLDGLFGVIHTTCEDDDGPACKDG